MKLILIANILLMFMSISAQTQSYQHSDKLNYYKNKHFKAGSNYSLDTLDINLILGANTIFSDLLTNHGNQSSKDCPEFGVYGLENDRLLVKINSVKEDYLKLGTFLVNGWYTAKNTNSLFNGKVEIIELIEYYNPLSKIRVWEINGVFHLKSDKNEILSGFIRSALSISLEKDVVSLKNKVYEEGNYKIWCGELLGEHNIKDQFIAWGMERFPDDIFPGFDVGGSELSIHYQYLENGWSKSFSKSKYIKDVALMIDADEFDYYGVHSYTDIINRWDSIEHKLDYSIYTEGRDKLDLGCD